MRIQSLLAALLLTATPALADRQVVAHQGAAEETAPQEFHSPMVLDLPLGEILHLKPSYGRKFPDVAKYICDDTSFESLLITRLTDTPAKKLARFRISGGVYVRASHDRLVRLRFSMLSGTRAIGTAVTAELDVEEKHTEPFAAEVSIPLGELEAFSHEGTPASLRVVVTVTDNR